MDHKINRMMEHFEIKKQMKLQEQISLSKGF